MATYALATYIKRISPYGFGFILALGGALLASLLSFPLPWLIGPLFITAITSMLGISAKCHRMFLRMGQWVIGISLGLYFTPSTVHALVHFLPYILLGSLFAILLSFVNAVCLYHWGKIDFKTAWFAGAVGGASEMANLAELHKAKADSVASSHSVRVLIIVIIIPFAYQFFGIQGDVVNTFSIPYHFNGWGLIALALLSTVGVWFFHRLGMPNPWVLGALFTTLLLTSNNIHLSHLSPTIQHLGQLFIGWSLGSKYSTDFFSRAPRYLSLSAIISLLGLALSVSFAYALSLFADIPLSTLILSVSPGGIAEMTITAKALHLGVPIVAAFHVTRLVLTLLTAQPMCQWLSRWFPS